MTDNDYLIAWGLYAFAALGCLLVWIKLTGWMWRYLREPLWVIGAVLLFCPTIVDPGKEIYAPALAITFLDLALKVGNNVWRAVLDLSTYGAVALGIYVILALIRLPFLRARKARQAHAEAAAQQAAAEQKAEDEPFSPQGPSRYATAPTPSASVIGGAGTGGSGASGNGRNRVEPKL